MSVDKNQAVIDFLLECPQIQGSPLYFNFINAKDNNKQFITSSNDVYTHRPYVDGSVRKRYTFTIIDFKSINDMALVTESGYPNENVEDMSDVQNLIDWINTSGDEHNYPNFGEECIIDSMITTSDEPRLESINVEITPPLAMYSVTIQIDYIDYSKKLWG